MLYIFDRDINFMGVCEGYFSFRWVRRYSKCGEFELHIGATERNIEMLKKSNIIYKKDDTEAGYINYVHLKQDIAGKETLIVKGKFISVFLAQRIIWGTNTLKTTVENAIRQLVNENCINTTNLSRKINNLILGDFKGYNEQVNYQVSYKNLLDEIENLANANELGIRTNLDINNKSFVFDVYKGVDRTAEQRVNPPAIFAKEFENILEQEYIESSNNFRNIALIAGEGEGELRQLAEVGDSDGLDRHELYVDARDLRKGIVSDVDYIKLLENRGLTKLSNYMDIRTFDSKINLNSNLVYKQDFDLGDLVTCTSKKWGIKLNTRITEVEEIYSSEGKKINVKFGNSLSTLIDKIKAVLN